MTPEDRALVERVANATAAPIGPLTLGVNVSQGDLRQLLAIIHRQAAEIADLHNQLQHRILEICRLREALATHGEIAMMWCEEFHRRNADANKAQSALASAEAALETERAKLNIPHIDDWFEGVKIEAVHQVERWGSDHDAGKAPLDWFWLIGYLAQKAATSAMASDIDKAKHHTISTAGALLNWFRALSGLETTMRPGIEPPRAALAEIAKLREGA